MDKHAKRLRIRMLVSDWIALEPEPSLHTTALVAAGLVLLLIVVSYFDGVFTRPFDALLWRTNLLGPVVVVYILVALPILKRLRRDATLAFRELIALPSDELERFIAVQNVRSLQREMLFLSATATVGVLILRPWVIEPGFTWTAIYRVCASGVMCGLGGLVIYSSLAGARLLHQLAVQPLRIHVFDPAPLEPIARRSLFLSLVILGAVTIGILLVPNQDARGVILNGSVILVAVLLFFVGLWDTHKAMVSAKARELTIVRERLYDNCRRVTNLLVEDPDADAKNLSSTSSLLMTYEKRIQEAPVWPFNASILRQLGVSALIPLVALLQNIAIERISRFIGGP